jgi:thiamine transporter ThiT
MCETVLTSTYVQHKLIKQICQKYSILKIAKNPQTIFYFRRGMKTEHTTTFLFFLLRIVQTQNGFFLTPK